jgi:hypothetical protein
MNDMRAVIVPKSDQINSDDLIAGPLTITITGVSIRPGTEQPVSINFDGDGGKPYKPCKSMARVMVTCWGADANEYVGRSMTLYRDPTVKWGGMDVGGIRISHMTDIKSAHTMALTATKGSKKPFTVKPLVKAADKPAAAAKAPGPDPDIHRAADFVAAIAERESRSELDQFISNPAFQRAMGAWESAKPDLFKQVDDAVADRIAALNEAA